MNNDATPPTAQTTAKTCHNAVRLRANASWISDLMYGGSVESSGMSAYRVGLTATCGTDWMTDVGSIFESSFWRTVLPIVTPQT